MRDPIQVAIIGRNCAYVRGWGSRDLLTELRGRPPLWLGRLRVWATTEPTARDAIALAEARRWPVEVVDAEHFTRLAGRDWAEGRGLLW